MNTVYIYLVFMAISNYGEELVNLIKVAMIGDVVGNHGLETLGAKLPALIKDQNIDFVTVNGENAADGFGMTEVEFRRIIAAGADVVTSGNHIWEKRDFWTILEKEKNMLRPANYPVCSLNSPETAAACAPGTGFTIINKKNINWVVINLQGRELMNVIECPFSNFDHLFNMYKNQTDNVNSVPSVILVDFHAESSREKEALAYYVDGRASIVAGTHTHVQTADERILPEGCGYITDLGMTGNTDSVIGMNPSICMERARRQVLYSMEVAVAQTTGQMLGIIAEIDTDTGKAVSIIRIK